MPQAIVHPISGRIHADYLQIGAASGRMACRRPNLQNIPRTPAYRACFRAPAGRVLVDRALAEQLEGDEMFKLRRLRRTSVRGYRRLEPWSLRRPADEDPETDEDGKRSGRESSPDQQGDGLRGGGDETDTAGEGTSGGEDVD